MALPEPQSQWYDALFEEDSLQLNELLFKHPNLLTVGWKSEPRLKVGTDDDDTQEVWKGRNVLHVAARRGNVELVLLVLALCDVTGVQAKWKTTIQKRKEELRMERQWMEKMGTSRSFRARAPSDPFNSNGAQSDQAESEAAQSDVGLPQSDPLDSDGAQSDQAESEAAQSEFAQSDFAGLAGFNVDGVPIEFSRFLSRLLSSKDGWYGLDAIAIAVLHGERNILLPLTLAVAECGLHGIRKDQFNLIDENMDTSGPRHRLRDRLRKVIIEFMEELDSFWRRVCLDAYGKHKDFNFLPWYEYMFHFLIFMKGSDVNGHLLFKHVKSESVWRYLLELQDGQGRTPLHVAVDEHAVERFKSIILEDAGEQSQEIVECAMAARDGAGRTALHRALATGDEVAVMAMESMVTEGLTEYDDLAQRSYLESCYTKPWRHSIADLGTYHVECLSQVNGFKGYRAWWKHDEELGSEIGVQPQISLSIFDTSPLHSAIIHKHAGSLLQLAKLSPGHLSGILVSLLSSNLSFPWVLKLEDENRFPRRGIHGAVFSAYERTEVNLLESMKIKLDTLELATLAGDIDCVKALLQTHFNGRSSDLEETLVGEQFKGTGYGRILNHPWPPLHLAATSENYELLKVFLDHLQRHDRDGIYAQDFKGNTALHHVMKVTTFEFHTHLLDYVSCRHLLSNDPRKEEKDHDKLRVSRIQGCINLLLQVGCDVFKVNDAKQPPYPQGILMTNDYFLSWWYKKQCKEFDVAQSSLSSAANAISITATLIATTSYVGPLQPPMSYAGDQVHDENIWVRIFIFCDTMSFYFAIAAIILSLIPALPMPQQVMAEEIRRTERMVIMAILVLFPAIIFILLAMASSSIAVVSAKLTSSSTGSLTLASTSVGGLFCLGTFILFFIRVLAFVFPRTRLIRKIYNFTTL